MKKYSLLGKWKIAGYICAVLGWWGVLYPEFAMTEDVCRVVYTEEVMVHDVNDCVETDCDAGCDTGICNTQNGSIYWEMLEAGPQKIQFRSKFLDKLQTRK